MKLTQINFMKNNVKRSTIQLFISDIHEAIPNLLFHKKKAPQKEFFSSANSNQILIFARDAVQPT